jgi:hypothetical protein
MNEAVRAYSYLRFQPWYSTSSRNVRCWHKRTMLDGCRLWLKMTVEDVVRETAGAGRTFGGSFADLQRNGHQVRARRLAPNA